MARNLLTIALLYLSCISTAQDVLLYGSVTDPEGQPIPGVTIRVQELNRGTATDKEGNFELMLNELPTTVLLSCIGFENQQIMVDSSAFYHIVLKESANRLNEVVVIGFGSSKKSTINNSISSIDAAAFSNVSVPNFQRVLQGRMPGVVVTNSSGGLNAEAIIRIRGTGSISARNQPLIVIDGLILTARPGDGFGYSTNPLIGIDPNDIASVEVLKDAAAAAIYGSRGSNGVILITTKKGRFNAAPRVELGYYAGVNTISKKRDLLTGPEYARLWNTAAQNVGESVLYSNPSAEPTTNWQDLLLRRGFVHQMNASVSGGSDDLSYYIGGSAREEDFYLRTIGLKRYSFRANLEHKIGSKWKAKFSVSPSRVVDQRTGNQWAGSPWGAAGWFQPNLTGTNEDGSCIEDDLYSSLGWVSYTNPCKELENRWTEATRTQVLVHTGLEWSPFNTLQISTTFGTEFNHEQQNLKYGKKTFFGGASGWAWAYRQEAFSYNWNTLINWSPQLTDEHALTITAGTQLTKEHHDYLTVDGSGFNFDNLKFIGAAALIEYVNTDLSGAAFAGYLARVRYSYRNKYQLSLAGRYDGSSRFGRENRWGFFPSISAGWVISEEDFFSKNIVDFLKIKASYGLTGNAAIANFTSRGLANANVNYLGQPGYIFSSLENGNLSWEKNLQWDAGITFSLWNGKFFGSASYFVKTTSDLLLDKPVPASNGFSTITSNVGKVRNQGIEFDLSLALHNGPIKWNMGLNGATLKNEVLKLVDQNGDGIDDDIIESVVMLHRPGQAIGSYFLAEYAGVDPDNGDALFFDEEGNKVPNYVADSNRKIAGKSQPSFTGGMSHFISFRNFDLRADFVFKTGFQIYMWDQNLEQNGTWGSNQNRNQLNYWSEENRHTDVPQPRLYQTNGTQRSTRYLSDGDYIRLQHLELGYNIPSEKLSMSKLRIFFASQNLWTLTKFRGLDPDSEFLSPEAAATGMVHFNLPAVTSFTFGINIHW